MKNWLFLGLAVGGLILNASTAEASSWRHRYTGGCERDSFHWSTSICYPSERVRYVRVVEAAPVDNSIVVNIPNDNGSYTPVTLRRTGGVYVGPRGEQYLNMPTTEQLKSVYGLK